MMNVPDANSIYAITPGKGDLPKLTLTAPDGARAQVYLYGAHVVSWIPAGGQERLFLSRASQYSLGLPVRGGIPVIFPQFGASGPLPLHGLARLMAWEFVGAQVVGDQASASFRLGDTAASRELWPHVFRLDYSVAISGSQLSVTLGVSNTGPESFTFTSAVHTYLSVSDLAATAVKGLSGLRCRDSAAGGVDKLESAPQIDFQAEVNRIYFAAPAEALLVEPDRRTLIRKSGFTDTVVWNPGVVKFAAVPDLQPDDYRQFVCVEAVTLGEPVQLAPGSHWQGSQTLVAKSAL